MNLAPLNGSALNGSRSHILYVAAAIVAGASVLANPLTISQASASASAGVSVRASAAGTDVTRAEIYASAVLTEKQYTVAIRNTSANASGICGIDLASGAIYSGAASIVCSATVYPFQGDAAMATAGATVSASAGVAHGAAAAGNSGASAQSTGILVAGGVEGLTGSITVNAEPSLYDASLGIMVHDGFANIDGICTIGLPSNPLLKRGYSYAQASANMTGFAAVKHATSVNFDAKASASGNATVDKYYSASVILPGITIVASPGVYTHAFVDAQLTGLAVAASGSVIARASALISAAASATSGGGLAAMCDAKFNAGLTLSFDAIRAIRITDANLTGEATILASMQSNPRAHAIERRTMTILDQDRSLIEPVDNREIIIEAA